MSLDLEHQLRVFLASAPQTRHLIQQISFSHSAIAPMHLWTEPGAGTVVTEGGATITVSGLDNLRIRPPGSPVHLDQALDITLSTVDPADTFRRALDAIPLDTDERIQVVYREYLSNDLSMPMAHVRMQVESISYNRGAALITAIAPRLNVTRTGELYTLKRFPTLRALT